jgi:nucleotide-binding universal stress UspA family protein
VGASVVAQHIVDTSGVHALIGHDEPGFLPSNPYSVTYDHICSGLRVMARILEDNYKEAAGKFGVASKFHIDEGDPVSKICQRAEVSDLVVIGHRKQEQAEQMKRCQIRRLSIAESLAHECSRPLLIVQEKVGALKTMTIMLSMDHVNEYYIDTCITLASFLGLTPEILCLAIGQHQESPAEFTKDLRKAHASIKDIPLSVATLREICEPGANGRVKPARLSQSFRDWSNCLPVMPTRKLAQERLTVLDDSPALFVRGLAVPALLLVPEEYVSARPASSKRKAATTR